MARIPRPFEQNYGLNLTVAIFAIAPYIVVTTAWPLFVNDLIAQLRVERTGLEIVAGLATAGYAFGALLAGDLIQRFVQRPLFFVCEALFVIGALLGAVSTNIVIFGAGSALLGFATGLLLIIALPAVVQRFPAKRLPNTAAFVNIGFFGAVCAGPLVGGMIGQAHLWRWLYGALAAFGVLTLVLSTLTLPEIEPKNPESPFDWHAILLGFAATVLPFWAAGELFGHGFSSPLFFVPLAIGGICFIAMLLTQYHKKEPLAPVKPMWNTLPLAGVIVATIGGGALVTLMELLEEAQLTVLRRSPVITGLAFWPELIGVLLTAFALGRALRTRFLMLLPLAGMVVLIAAALILAIFPDDGPWPLTLFVAGLLGLGAGATVAPGLWVAALSLPANLVGRTFALVELVRSEGDFIMAPVILQFAQIFSVAVPLTMSGIRFAAWIAVAVAVVSTIAIVAIFLAGGAALRTPDIDHWLEDKEHPAWESPPLGAALRPKRHERTVSS